MLLINDFFFLLPELFFIFSSIYLLLVSTDLTSRLRFILTQRFGYIFIYVLFLFIYLISSLPTRDYLLLNYQYASESFFFFCKLIFVCFLIIFVYVSVEYFFLEKIYFTEYYPLLGFLLISAFFLISSNDFFIFYFSLELQALILYTLASLKRTNSLSTESGLKYFILGAFSSGLILFGISLFYGFFGITCFLDLKFIFLKWLDFSYNYASIAALLFILSGILFKFAAAPFHVWAPDVYTGSPTPVVLIISVLPKLAVMSFIIRLYIQFLFEIGGVFSTVFLFSGVLSVFWATIAALNQIDIKRLYSYSAIVNIGYLLIALNYSVFTGFVDIFNYIVTYFISVFGLFAFVLLIRRSPLASKIKLLADFTFYFSYNPMLALLVSLIFFSLGGVPPLSGFFAKFFLFRFLFAVDFLSNSVFFPVLLFSTVSAFYYIRCIQFIFFNPNQIQTLNKSLDYLHIFLFVNCGFFLIFFFLFQSTVYLSFTLFISKLFL